MSSALTPAQIRALRPPRTPPDPWRPMGVREEAERSPTGPLETATLFLAGAECAYACVFCDLWRHTLTGPTPPGAVPAQIESGLAGLQGRPEVIKLYNASNFFAESAVPQGDDERILGLLRGFSRVVVECHPRLIGDRCFRFAASLVGVLEVAMGLESVDRFALSRLGKQATLEDFRSAARELARRRIDLRIFLLVGTPYVPAASQLESVSRSLAEAERLGARHVSLIPVRGGNGALEELARRGHWEAPRLALVEAAFERCLAEATTVVVTVDLWDLERIATCDGCFEDRRRRLEQMNLSGKKMPRVVCPRCGPELG